MSRPVTIVVTGFTRNTALLAMSMEAVTALRRSGHAARAIYLTWDTPALDPFIEPLKAMPEIELVRVPEPEIGGVPHQRGVYYQVKSLEAALNLVSGDDTPVLKLRPDFVAKADFLRTKIEGFESLPPPRDLPIGKGLAMPKSPFKARLWLPWADANQPFWFEDAAFLGLKRDVARLVTPLRPGDLDALGAPRHGPLAHIIRFGKIFEGRYPLFTRYLQTYHYFLNDTGYRTKLMAALLREPFYWHLVVANAWILATSFHIDCGPQGSLALYGNNYNAAADWSDLASLRINNPYDRVDEWRAAQKPGKIMPAIARLYGRLVDDSWPRAVFGGMPGLDMSEAQLRDMLKNIVNYRSGALAQSEAAYYATLEGLSPLRQAAA